MISNPKHFNSIMVRDTASAWVPARMFHSLVERDTMTMEHVPVLAESWEVAEDGLSITFRLRQGIRWSDGEPFTADDVMFTWRDLWLNPDVGARRVIWELPDGTMPSFEKIDDYTVRVIVSTWFRPLLGAVGDTPILPRHKLWQYVRKLNPALEKCQFNTAWGVDVDPKAMVGTGPYVLEKFIPDLAIKMVRNLHYWQFDPAGTQLPYFDRLLVHIVESIDVAILKFRAGKTDAVGPRPEDVAAMVAEARGRGYRVLIHDTPHFGQEFLSFLQDVEDPNLRGLFRDLRFRQAMSHSIDRDEIIDGLFLGMGVELWSPVSIPSPFYAPEKKLLFRYNLDKARALLDDIGLRDTDGDGIREFPDRTPVRFTVMTNAGNTLREGIGLLLQADLRKIGIDMIFTPIPFPTLVGRLTSATGWEGVIIGFTGAIDPHGAGVIWKSTGDLHFWRFSAGGPDGRLPEKFPVADPMEWSARVDELWALQAAAKSDAEAFPYFAEFQRIVAENLPVIYTAARTFQFAIYDHLGNADWSNVNATVAGARGVIFGFLR